MKISILDDDFDTFRTLQHFRKLDGHDVTIWNDQVDDLDLLADRLQAAEALVAPDSAADGGAEIGDMAERCRPYPARPRSASTVTVESGRLWRGCGYRESIRTQTIPPPVVGHASGTPRPRPGRPVCNARSRCDVSSRGRSDVAAHCHRLAGRRERDVLEYLIEENRVLRQTLDGRL